MTTAAETEKAPAAAATPRVEAVVVGNGAAADAPAYPMFDVNRLEDRRAFLGGPLLFELGEEFLLELRRGGERTRVRARVVRVDRGSEPGVEVELLDPVTLSEPR
jgi:hypothetical protein